MKQNIEARGERLKQKLLIPMDEEEAKKDFMFTTEIKETVTKDKKEKCKEKDAFENQDEEDLEQSLEEAQTKDEKPTFLRII